jgi:hypothetical protein
MNKLRVLTAALKTRNGGWRTRSSPAMLIHRAPNSNCHSERSEESAFLAGAAPFLISKGAEFCFSEFISIPIPSTLKSAQLSCAASAAFRVRY